MHAFTLTIHSYLYTKLLSDDDLEKITEKYAVIVEGLMEEHELDKYFTTEVYWRRGCLDICFAFLVIDPATWIAAKGLATAAGTGIATLYATIAAYPNAREGYRLIKKDLSNSSVDYKGNKVKPSEIHECEGKPHSTSKKLDR